MTPCRGGAEEGERTVLVLRVANEGKYNEKFTNLVHDYLRKSAIAVISSGSLTPAQRKCNEPECLTGLAKDSLILTANVTVRDEDHFINVSIFDAKSGRNRTADDVCERNEVERRLKALTGRLVDEAKGGGPVAPPPVLPSPRPQPAVPMVVTPALSAPAVSLPRVKPRLFSLWQALPTSRRILTGALLGTAALSLGGAITLNVVDAHQDCVSLTNYSGECAARATGLYATGYAVAGAALIGAGLALCLPNKGGKR